MRIFVTGGSGFLGQRLIRRLVAEGHEVTGLARSEEAAGRVTSAGARAVQGSLNDILQWSPALDGQDILVHAASPIDVWGRWSVFRRDVVDATLQLYEVAAERRVKRFIHISSESVLQDRAPLLDIDETAPYPAEPNSLYGKAKKLAEEGLVAHARDTTLIILRPAFIWGPGDSQLSQLLARIRDGRFVWVDQGRAIMDMSHVDNVVEAVRLAMNHGMHKRIYYVTDDDPMPVREFLGSLIEALGYDVPTRSVPLALVKPLAPLVEGAWRLLERRDAPPLSRFQLDFVALPRRYRLDRIKHDLGYRPVIGFAQGLRDLAARTPPEMSP